MTGKTVVIFPGFPGALGTLYKFEADRMSSFQDMTYYDLIIGIFLNFFLSKVIV